MPSIGYCHHGIERAAEANNYHKYPYLVERVCGICSFVHAMTYCRPSSGWSSSRSRGEPPICGSSGPS